MDDFVAIGQTQEDLSLDVAMGGSLEDIVDVRNCEGFAFPAMLLSGVRFNDALKVLKDSRVDSYRCFDVWVDLGNGNMPYKVGTMPATMDSFIIMRYLGINVTLYLNEDTVMTLNLSDPTVLESFM